MDSCVPSTSTSTIVPSTSFATDKSGQGSSASTYRPPSCKSPNFNFLAVGNEAEKLKWLVLQHVKPSTFKKVFAPLMARHKNGINRTDELTCVEACMLLRALEPSDKNKQPTELEQACYGLIGLLNTEKNFLRAIDRIITKIIITAAEEKIISLLLASQLLVTSIDFRMLKAPNPAKIKFVRKSMEQMDYKNMRDLLKLLLVEKLDKMHCQLDEYQHGQLAPIEELVIDLIDRRKNFCPALFFITEISRIDTDHSSIHFLPRVSLKIREMVASFRPLAEIGCMLGRSWMWPVPASPVFSWSSQTWSAWKLDEKHCKLYFKTHLPYSSENSSPQTYLQYILFKQPHGQDNLNHILRSTSSQSQAPRLQCDEVIQLLILEAMCAMEDSEQPVLAPINQYNWLHLSHLVTYALWMGHCTLSQLLMMLLPQLKSCQYLRAKEELMWILLQYIAHAKSKEKNAQQQAAQAAQSGGHPSAMIALPASGGLGAQNRELVLEIFNVLYGPDKSMNWGDTCSTEQPLNMVRFFAPAAIWINLVSSASATPGAEHLPQPQPPEKLRTLIDFIEKQLRDNKEQKQLEKNSALLAVVANAYSNTQEVFDEHVNNTIFRMLGHHQPSQQQLMQQPEKWTLPGGRKTEPFLRALELGFLDSLTFHAKRQLYYYSLGRVFMSIYYPPQQQPQHCAWRLPSPALVESTARLLLSTELCDQNGQRFYHYALLTLKSPPPTETKDYFFARNDLLALFLELLNFRLQNIGFGWKWELNTRITFLYNVIEQLLLNQSIIQSAVPSHVQMCQLLEQTVLRFAQCTWPQDMLNTLQKFTQRGFENFLCKCVLRAAKLLGDGQMQLIAPELGWQWPRADIQWFPMGVQQMLFEQLTQYEHDWMGKHTQRMLELEQASAQEMQHLVHLDSEYFGQSQSANPVVYNTNTQPPALLISIFRCLYQFQLPNFQLPPPAKPPHPSAPNFFALCYKLLGSLGNKDLHKLTNAFVDWIAWKFAWLDQESAGPTAAQPQEEYDLHHMIKVLNDMLFSQQFLSVERLLLSMALHPTEDQSIRTLLCLLAALLDSKFSQLSERLHACYAFAPAHSQTTNSNSEDFFVQMAEYYKKYPEFPFAELYRRAVNAQLQPEPPREGLSLPIYYGHLAERICPIVDVLLQRALGTEVKPAVLDTLLRHFSPIYRIHPQPMIFLYTTLYSLDGVLLAQQRETAITGRPVRKFVLEIVLKLEQEEAQSAGRTTHSTPGKLLTSEFIQHDHQMSPMKFCRILVERIVQASTYTHQPPPFVHHDWRFAEFSPAAQTLTSAWVELLVSRHTPADLIDALVQLAIRRPISRPQDTLNALGLLLTGLPASFQSAFLDKIEQSFDWEQIAHPDADPSQLFESLSHEVYLHSESRILSMLALIHSFCQHGGNNSLSIIPDLIVQRLAPKVQNEAQLLYFLRIVVPYLQRIHEKERSRHMTEIVAIYQVLGHLTRKNGKLHYEDTICDLLYQFKYMFVGYSLKEQTEAAIRAFPDSMREKLKFLLTHSSSAAVAAETQQQQMQQMLQQQQILQHQSSQGSLVSVPVPIAHPPHPFSQLSTTGGQQAPLPPPAVIGTGFDPAMVQQQPAALIGMLRRQSSESGVVTAAGPHGQMPGIIQGAQGVAQLLHQPPPLVPTVSQQQQQMPSTPQQLPISSANASPNPPSQFLTSSMAQKTSNPGISIPMMGSSSHSTANNQLAPPPPYPQDGGVSIPPMSIGMEVQSFPGQIPLTTSNESLMPPVNFQQMMVPQQQGQAYPVNTAPFLPAQVGYSNFPQSHMPQMASRGMNPAPQIPATSSQNFAPHFNPNSQPPPSSEFH